MTANPCAVTKDRNPLSAGKIIFGLLGVFSLLLILRNSDIAIDYMSRGLSLCAKTVVPSLFPFMVLAEMIVSSGAISLIPYCLQKPLQKLFRLSPEGCSALLVGLLCGFPIGARCTVLALERGGVSREEAERLLAFSNVPSSAFLISAVGGSLYGNPRFGIALYATVLLSAIVTGIGIGRLPKKTRPDQGGISLPVHINTHQPPVLIFCNSIQAALRNILLVCSYVIFFSALLGTLQFLPLVQELPEAIKALLFCTFEISGGVSHAAALKEPLQAALLTAAGVGWSGLSVHCQIISICDGYHLSMRTYFAAKLFQALLCTVTLAIVLGISPTLLLVGTPC